LVYRCTSASVLWPVKLAKLVAVRRAFTGPVVAGVPIGCEAGLRAKRTQRRLAADF